MKKDRNYFTHDTELAIIEYRSSGNSEIYRTRIYPAFFALTESLIHTFQMNNSDGEPLLNLQQDVIIHLNTTLEKFDTSKNKKAYSYFNAIAYKHLIYLNKLAKKRQSQTETLDTSEDTSGIVPDTDLSTDRFQYSTIELSEVLSKFVKKLETLQEKKVKKGSDEWKIYNAAIMLFTSYGDLDNLEKKAVYCYLRTITDLPSIKITPVLKQIYAEYKKYLQKEIFPYYTIG